GNAWAMGALAVTVLALLTGYIGGEVLVFHAGMGVKAAAEGALAPPLAANRADPTSMMDAMHRLRPLWAASTGLAPEATTRAPTPEDFAQIGDASERMQQLASWVSDWALEHPKDDEAQKPALHELATNLQHEAAGLQRAAAASDLQATLTALGRTSGACADCH